MQGLGLAGVQAVHEELLRVYLGGRQHLANISDDGYIMQNVGHHLVVAKRFQDLKRLLTNTTWLESKLHSYGVASVVADYRRLVQVFPAWNWQVVSSHLQYVFHLLMTLVRCL